MSWATLAGKNEYPLRRIFHLFGTYIPVDSAFYLWNQLGSYVSTCFTTTVHPTDVSCRCERERSVLVVLASAPPCRARQTRVR